RPYLRLCIITPPPPELYTLSLHDALPISSSFFSVSPMADCRSSCFCARRMVFDGSSFKRLFTSRSWLWVFFMELFTALSDFSSPDRKSTRLNSSHVSISYAVFCLKKKKHI